MRNYYTLPDYDSHKFSYIFSYDFLFSENFGEIISRKFLRNYFYIGDLGGNMGGGDVITSRDGGDDDLKNKRGDAIHHKTKSLLLR